MLDDSTGASSMYILSIPILPNDEQNMHAKTAKVFTNGGSQAVRLPAEYRFDTREVLIERIGQSLLITPKRRGDWKHFFASKPVVPADFLLERDDAPPQPRDALA